MSILSADLDKVGRLEAIRSIVREAVKSDIAVPEKRRILLELYVLSGLRGCRDFTHRELIEMHSGIRLEDDKDFVSALKTAKNEAANTLSAKFIHAIETSIGRALSDDCVEAIENLSFETLTGLSTSTVGSEDLIGVLKAGSPISRYWRRRPPRT